jgi:hypothetical protein
MLHDRQLRPRQLKNHRGELVFDLHPAKLLLHEDIKAGVHAEMVPSQFQGTRPEYEEFDCDIFRQWIYQEGATKSIGTGWMTRGRENKESTRNSRERKKQRRLESKGKLKRNGERRKQIRKEKPTKKAKSKRV